MLIINEKAAMYASVADLASYMGLSSDTVRRITNEMKEYRGRYPYAIGKSGGILRVNILAFIDYFINREKFKGNKPVPPFNAKAVRESLGAQLTFERREK